MLRLNLEVLRKPVNTDVGIAAHAVAREPPCHPCIHSEISQVSKLQDKHNASFDNPICPAGACLRPGAKVRKKQDYPLKTGTSSPGRAVRGDHRPISDKVVIYSFSRCFFGSRRTLRVFCPGLHRLMSFRIRRTETRPVCTTTASYRAIASEKTAAPHRTPAAVFPNGYGSHTPAPPD